MNTQEFNVGRVAFEKISVVDWIKNMNPLDGRRPAFACFFDSEQVFCGIFNKDLCSIVYGSQSVISADRIAEWSEGLAVACLAYALREYQANVACVLEDNNTWTTHIRFHASGMRNALWNSIDCWTSIFFAACEAMEENGINIPIDDLCEMFRPKMRDPKLPIRREDGQAT